MITQLLPVAFLMNLTLMELFIHGGPIMWPILLTSFIAITVIVERIIFIIRENSSREEAAVELILDKAEKNDIEGAIAVGKKSSDFVARVLVYALEHRESSFANALVRASNRELARFQQGLPTLDTVIPIVQLMGLLGTVTGMMRVFGALGEGDIAANASQITGGVGEALIAVATGLAIAITAMLPFNYLNTRAEQAKHDLADAASALEIILHKHEAVATAR
ncbi:flagellar motor protein MotA [Cephaloticoccus primus]|uniref:Flagellar motor protein MotA n=1 Tax=Cephaloticoccus primus TaxID=1548207 RepID=A0A139SP97_9BACT|nr:MotA/TolQ/ExbB proton channel family protein [Cephaloticoccus primus]KXU36376.1 flagellar motor protein MotA [Cephaloticoccus primus]